ncbi:hypothetical protein STRTUCAR8_03160 [Streptomyces turgidiscabies Car8]|uniref:Uncharacterized protein n=1 Tax=Streptomyces turgidiscabies (strain Car8) TaxID=698760 RepID=L7EUM5_STRT8|nr:hypothetical protein STRTUCAR8_03160 [Streptomyces turgidiscabies Car8]
MHGLRDPGAGGGWAGRSSHDGKPRPISIRDRLVLEFFTQALRRSRAPVGCGARRSAHRRPSVGDH